MPSKNIFEDVLNDVFMMGTLAASIFVKNPGHQQEAANMIQAASKMLQLIDAQLNGTATTAQ